MPRLTYIINFWNSNMSCYIQK